MKRFIATAAILAAATVSQAQLLDVELTATPIKVGATTNALITDEVFDVWGVYANNPNAGAATSLELTFAGDFFDLGGTTFLNNQSDPGNPQVFGNEAPDALFVLPDAVDPADVLAVETTDSTSLLTSSYTVAGGADLIPGSSENVPVAVISVVSGTAFDIQDIFQEGRAAIGGEFATVVAVPEPTTALLAGLALVGFVARRK